MERIIKIGQPGKFDLTFGIIKYKHEFLSEPLYLIVWKDSGQIVDGLGGFLDCISAENYVKKNRNKLIDKEFEKSFLINE